eukprot:798691-Pleurochrysis_carterae.AAC.2
MESSAGQAPRSGGNRGCADPSRSRASAGRACRAERLSVSSRAPSSTLRSSICQPWTRQAALSSLSVCSISATASATSDGLWPYVQPSAMHGRGSDSPGGGICDTMYCSRTVGEWHSLTKSCISGIDSTASLARHGGRNHGCSHTIPSYSDAPSVCVQRRPARCTSWSPRG